MDASYAQRCSRVSFHFFVIPGAGPAIDGTGAELYPGALADSAAGLIGVTGAAAGALTEAGAGGVITIGAAIRAGITAGPWSRPYVASSGTIISATMLMILISGFTAGPAVSLYGSPK